MLALDSPIPPILRRASAAPATVDLLVITLLLIASRLVLLAFAQYYGAQPMADTCRWDCIYYGEIATNGYQPYEVVASNTGLTNWVYFPFFPLLWRALATILPFTAAGYVLSNIACLALAYTALQYLRATRDNGTAWLFVILLLFGPYSFYFAIPYSEALFALLFVLALEAWRRRGHLHAAPFAALLSATRPLGVFFTLGMFAALLQRHGKDLPRAALRDASIVLSLVIAPLGLFVYMFHLYRITGDGFAFVHGQVLFGRLLDFPWTKLYEALFANDLHRMGEDLYSRQYFGLWGLLGLALATVLLVQRRWLEGITVAVALLIALSAGIWAIPRYIVGLPPLGFATATLLARVPGRWLLLAMLVPVNLWLFTFWLDGHLVAT